ncbi:DUF485 domain-containing protein [Kitasatospora cinereorecta]|uniref:Uncharacterized membrane protein (DUF485 family) n=1 Tax=Kitasatospora paracochleata TaxID=58354 RepID=A0ABT1ISS7_9ACTN|nr:DUF485 domain-containing protein [Kitasatospora paracochleata]MCP2308157.1 uncharacterized membrane protein (DUF485 family) [Kitasatospora paracochleata]
MDSPPQTTPETLQRLEETTEFQHLRRSFRGFAFPVTAAFLLWYLLYVLLSSYAPDFMGTTVFGHVNVALVMGLLQFASTFAIAAWYARYAGRRLDPPAAELRERHAGEAVVNPREAAE